GQAGDVKLHIHTAARRQGQDREDASRPPGSHATHRDAGRAWHVPFSGRENLAWPRAAWWCPDVRIGLADSSRDPGWRADSHAGRWPSPPGNRAIGRGKPGRTALSRPRAGEGAPGRAAEGRDTGTRLVGIRATAAHQPAL